MAWEIQGKVGLQGFPADGGLADLRLARDLALVVGDAHGRYYENASRGLSFIATTAIAGISPGTALGASPPLAIANPAGSGRNIAILKTRWQWLSGTFGTGNFVYAQGLNPAALPAETTAAVRSSTLLSGQTTNANDIAKAYSGVSLTNTPVLLTPSAFQYSALTAALPTTGPLTPPQFEEIAGKIIVAPGAFFAIQGIGGAGTSPLCLLSISYEVVPQ